MSTNTGPPIPDSDSHPFSWSEQRAGPNPFDDQPVRPEPTRTERKTDDILDSKLDFDSEKFAKDFHSATLELQLGVDDSNLPFHAMSAGVSKKSCPTRVRAIPGRWQQFSLRWLTAYQVLISAVVLFNLGVLVFQTIANPTVQAPLTATAANIMAAVLLRQEEVINTSFKLVSRLPSTLPLSIRETIGAFHHYGGVHIGCALSALLWYIVFTGLNTVRVLDLLLRGSMTAILYVDIITAYAALLTILIVCTTSMPRFRVRFHNTFEVMHRFGGWATLAVLWIHAGITSLTPDTYTPLHAYPSLWMLAITTFLILLPWTRIRRVPVTAHPISAREVQLTFPYPSMPYTSTIRTSTSPLTEWHAFATIPVSSMAAKIVISKAGDWTSSLAASPPSSLWIRHPPMLNFLTFAPLFNSLLLVATGAGIGPMLSLLASPSIARMRSQGKKVKVMWCVAEPNAPHWAFVLAAIRDVDRDAKIFDSKVWRPDVPFEARYLAQIENVEAVMVVSNPRVTKEVVDECKIAGFAAYGAVFDS